MRLRWVDPEVVTIPDVGQVRPGVEFTIDDARGADLLLRKVAERVDAVVSHQVIPEVSAKKDMRIIVDDAEKEH